MMSFLQFSFYFFSAVMLTAAIRVVTVNNPVKAALYLVLAFLVQPVSGLPWRQSF